MSTLPMLQQLHDTIKGHPDERLFRSFLNNMPRDSFRDLLVLLRQLEGLNGTTKRLLIARLRATL